MFKIHICVRLLKFLANILTTFDSLAKPVGIKINWSFFFFFCKLFPHGLVFN